jgi:hypothetical protein
MPDDSVQFTNLDSNETIPTTFDVTGVYTNNETSDATITVSCPTGMVSPPSVTATAASTGTFTVTLTHSGAGSGHTITATMTLGTATIGEDDAEGVLISDTPPITITATDRFARKLPIVDPTKDIKGTYAPSQGDGVILLIEKRGKKRQTIVFADPATLNATAKTWSHPAVGAGYSKDTLRAVLTNKGQVVTIARAILK